jgi:hypothetical protein
MSRNQRLALLGLAVVVLVAGFVIAKSGSDGNGSSSDTTSTPAASATTGGSGTTDNGGTPAKPAVQTVVVKNAKPVGGIKVLKFNKGGTIRFKVTSDTADEIHFHGYDIGKDVEAGGSVSFNVPAKIDGKFEVELEDHKEQIASVEVAP